MNLSQTHPAVEDLRKRARRRIPHFVWEYLDSGTGDEHAIARNYNDLDNVLLNPAVLQGLFDPDLRTNFLGTDYPLPFGVAPIGMSGLIWPNAERLLAATAAKHGIPYSLSTVACRTPDEIAPVLGKHGWFQLYPPADTDIRDAILKRARNAGFKTLILTVDVPVASRRERLARSGLTMSPRLTPRILAQIAQCPVWALGTLKYGRPNIPLIEEYTTDNSSYAAQVGRTLRTSPDYDYLRTLRDIWDGPLLVKGVMRPDDAEAIQNAGADGIWVSNHAARQLDAAPSSVSVLPKMRAKVGPDYPIIFDSGIRSGLDILRALALGADFVMMGRAFHYGIGAFGAKGADHVVEILKEDMIANMGQIGAKTLKDVPGALAS